MEKYARADNTKTEEQFGKNEIRVTTQGKMRRYISYATNLLNDTQAPVDHITLKAMGKAINKTVAIAEIIKRRIPGLHQITEIDSTDIKEKYNPVEEGLEVVETTRHVSSIQISLFTKEPDTESVGYQPPIDPSEVKPPATRRTNPKGPRATQPQTEESPQDAPATESYPPARTGGRGRGRGRRGRRGGARAGSYPPPENYNNNYQGGYAQQHQQGGYGGPRQQGGGFPNSYQGGGGYGGQQGGYGGQQGGYGGQQGGYGGQQGGYGGPGYHRGGRRGGRRGGYGAGRRQTIQQPQ